MTFLLLLLLALSGIMTIIWGVSTPFRAWQSKSYFWNSILVVALVAVDLVLLDALNWIPGLF